ncbi:uncharacterized protein LOC134246882 [Saccostrea cucullata]|uniref:uncharacterized protein LOC134246882 n=1 Tax=Saccostrea cuccullata TaxID=36930 RepID=UPI002ED5BB1E
MTTHVRIIYSIRFVYSDGRETATSLLYGKKVLCYVLDFVMANDITAYLSVHKPAFIKENGNPFSVNPLKNWKCPKKGTCLLMHTKKENADIKINNVPVKEKSVVDELTKGNEKTVITISWNRGAVVITTWIVCLCSVLMGGNAQRCMESLPTLKKISSCPVNAAQWNAAALRKRCSKVEQSCCSRKDFVYHCLVNAFGNETVEVCAQRRKTNYCVEFNSLGALIQPNFEMNCTSSTIHCGKFYNSTDMYKVPQCILVSKLKVNTTQSETAQPLTLNTISTTRANFHSTSTSYFEISTKRPRISRNTGQSSAWIYAIIIVVLGLFGYAIYTIYAFIKFLMKRRKPHKTKMKQETRKENDVAEYKDLVSCHCMEDVNNHDCLDVLENNVS